MLHQCSFPAQDIKSKYAILQRENNQLTTVNSGLRNQVAEANGTVQVHV